MKNNSSESAIILLSGGLDSLVALDYSIKSGLYNIELALTFDYGQKALANEVEASENICKYYGINHKVIKLDWLKDITKTSLVSEKQIPKENLNTKKSAKAVWIPNRNALFINIAACFCDTYGCKHIIFGANRDEGRTFSDNTEAFRQEISNVLKTSTLVKPDVIAPLINYSKDDIVRIAVKNAAPLELVWSCYDSGSIHCGQCESCNHLKKALIANHCEKYTDILFGKCKENL